MLGLVVTVFVVVAALVAMSLYVQRAYQGYLYANASSQGEQFDPTNFDVTETVSLTQKADITVESGPSVELLEGDEHLPSTPGGVIPGEATRTEVNTETDWTITRTGTYVAN